MSIVTARRDAKGAEIGRGSRPPIGSLTLWQLYLVVFLCGIAAVFFDVANLSYLPHIAGRDRFVEANSALNAADSVIMLGGKGIAGYVIQLVRAPIAVAPAAAAIPIALSPIRRLHRLPMQDTVDDPDASVSATATFERKIG